MYLQRGQDTRGDSTGFRSNETVQVVEDLNEGSNR